MSDQPSLLDDPHFRLPVFAILVERLGGQVTITQADFDKIAYDRLVEDYGDGQLVLTHHPRGAAS